jgi:hypothetical protein
LNQIRGKSYQQALMLLEFMPYKACGPVWQVIYSAAANAEHNLNLKKENSNVVIIKKECDSLKSEIFTKDIQIGRYEHIFDLLDTELDVDCKTKVDELKGQTE